MEAIHRRANSRAEWVVTYNNLSWQSLRATWDLLDLLKKLNIVDKASVSFIRRGYYDEEVLFTIQNLY